MFFYLKLNILNAQETYLFDSSCYLICQLPVISLLRLPRFAKSMCPQFKNITTAIPNSPTISGNVVIYRAYLGTVKIRKNSPYCLLY